MQSGVVGINHKLADLKLREKLAQICEEKLEALRFFCHGRHAFVQLSTCNRTEIYFSSDDLALAHSDLLNLLSPAKEEGEFDQKLYSYFGIDCFTHLAKVTAGLDSAIIGETEIQNQVKLAYEKAASFGLPHDLHFLFQKGLGIAKKVRTDLQLGRGMPNLEHAIFQTGRHFFNSSLLPKILFIGASDINLKVLCFLQSKGLTDLTLCNRSEIQEKKRSLIPGVKVVKWEELNRWSQFDWVILATKAPSYLIHFCDIEEKNNSRKLIMDLSVPRNVNPKLGMHPQVTLMNIDQINRLLKIRHRRMLSDLITAEERIKSAAKDQVARFSLKKETRLNCVGIA